MTIDQQVCRTLTAAVRPTPRALSPVCGCGQDLDVCAGEHCPRCGAFVGSCVDSFTGSLARA